MHRRGVEHADEGVVGDASEEVHARRIDRDLGEQALAIALARRQAPAVADLVAADHQDLGPGPAAQDLGQRAHEDVEAAIGLEVARDVGDDLGVGRQHAAVGQIDLAEAARRQRVGVDALVDDADARPEIIGVAALLPFGRRQAPIGRVHAEQVDRVLGAHPEQIVEAGDIFGIEADVGVVRAVEELEVAEQRRLGEHVLEEERLAPPPGRGARRSRTRRCSGGCWA